MSANSESICPSTPSSAISPDTSHRPLPALPAANPPFATRRPTKSSSRGYHAAPSPMKTNLEPVMEGDGRLMRDVHSPPPGDVRRLGKKASGPELSRQRSQYFEDAFRSKTSEDSPNSRSSASSIILAEVKTNVFIADEFNFITELARHLSTRYNHHPAQTVISLQHGVCLHFGGTFDPAYTIAVHAPPALLQPATNRRNVVLMQDHLEEALRVGPARGFVRFVPVPQECSGWRGNTAAGAREKDREMREKSRDEARGKNREKSPTQKKRTMRSLSIKNPRANEAKSQKTKGVNKDVPETLATDQTGEVKVDSELSEAEPGRGLRKKKSFIHSFFVKTQRYDAP